MSLGFNDTIPGTTVTRGLHRDDLIVITGAGGFIAGSLTRYFHEQGYANIRAIDRKPLPDWYLRVPGVESILHGPQPRAERHRRRQGRDDAVPLIDAPCPQLMYDPDDVGRMRPRKKELEKRLGVPVRITSGRVRDV